MTVDNLSQKIQPEESRGIAQQLRAAIVVNILSVGYGTAVGWVSPLVERLRGDESPVPGGPWTEESVSWLSATLCLGGLLATGLLGPLAERFGRKGLGYLSALPFLVCWLIKAHAPGHEAVILARFLAGAGGAGVFFLTPIFVGEIALAEVRGVLGSLLVLAVNVGILLGYASGPLLPYQMLAYLCMAFPIAFLVGFYFLPETPVFLVRQNRLPEAHSSLMFYRGGNKEIVEEELTRLKSQCKESISSDKPYGLSELNNDPSSFRAMIIALCLMAGQQLSGIFAMLTYATQIFERSGSSISADNATVVIGTIQVCSSYLSTVLVERLGRRLLILVSCLGMFLSHMSIGTFYFLQDLGENVSEFSWVPLLALSVFVVAYCLGMGPVPFVIVSELFRPEVAGLANSICSLELWFAAFLMSKFFNSLTDFLGLGLSFLGLGTVALLTLLFTLGFVPETKGRTVHDITDALAHGFRTRRCDSSQSIAGSGVSDEDNEEEAYRGKSDACYFGEP